MGNRKAKYDKLAAADRKQLQAQKAYKLRSKLVRAESFLHGLGSVLPMNQHESVVLQTGLVLRRTVNQALLDIVLAGSSEMTQRSRRAENAHGHHCLPNK